MRYIEMLIMMFMAHITVIQLVDSSIYNIENNGNRGHFFDGVHNYRNIDDKIGDHLAQDTNEDNEYNYVYFDAIEKPEVNEDKLNNPDDAEGQINDLQVQNTHEDYVFNYVYDDAIEKPEKTEREINDLQVQNTHEDYEFNYVYDDAIEKPEVNEDKLNNPDDAGKKKGNNVNKIHEIIKGDGEIQN
ncbi:hypothetical protein MS3_00008287 [Schistosoma haematobium]|uniref:Uncharacterized protein n=1 Tax=Schistosoma haematobium TaxID=6185 RepID=A0A922LFC0_SCHHA|nr:hypothetical protein MS3_00008287 [Schistosoma haematobium]KAH9581034.1 hypothetical protein MS3_00008287 [Schistosoma haematobium]